MQADVVNHSADLFAGVAVIDVDTHLNEPHDLWTSRAPKGYEDRVPSVHEVDGELMWTIDGSVVLGRAGGASVVRPDGTKVKGAEFFTWQMEDAHPAASSLGRDRLAVMDDLGIWAHIVYPNVVGFGGQKFGGVEDPELRRLCCTLYNDAMAEYQEASGGRFFPMAMIPYWDIDVSIAEVERVHAMGLRGVNTSSDPQNQGGHDLAERYWDPFWDLCSDLGMPINFHIGASENGSSWFGQSPWPSFDPEVRLAMGGASFFLSNARVIGNLLYSGIFERYPKLKVVSVESGIGWIPFMLETLDYQWAEAAEGAFDHLSLRPSEYFRRNLYGCFWFEERELNHTIDVLGEDNVMFETDFPHPTCLYPNSMVLAAERMATMTPERREKLLSANAARVYNIELPAPVRR
jgi:predicted TIM-barrel fold metal-dependent hydrolase